MNDAVLSYYLALSYAPGVGSVNFSKIVDAYPNLEALFKSTKADLIAAGFKQPLIEYLHNPAWQKVEKDLAWQDDPLRHILIATEEHYPELLRESYAVPPLIYVQGDPIVLHTPQLAIVGTRNPTTLGSQAAFQFAEHLASCGLTITSGLALGIDGISHQGALAAGGLTLAVLGSGLNNIYPSRHLELADKIMLNRGAIISEFSPDTEARPENFPRRNRIISALSLGVFVVEAALQSGSLITAKYALEQGREIFAMPGSIHNTLAKGCHALIKQGAKLVESSADILEELTAISPALLQKAKNSQPPVQDLSLLDDPQRKLVECIEYAATAMDVIIHRSGLSAEAVSAMVMMLELQGYVQAVNGGYARL